VSLFTKHAHLQLDVIIHANALLTRQTQEQRFANIKPVLRVQIVRQISAILDIVLRVKATNVILFPWSAA
jgi:hypothetical protein